MTSSDTPTDPTGPADLPVPNHHADHPGFSGLNGHLKAIAFLFGRDDSARLAIELAGLQNGDRVVDVGCGPGGAVHLAHQAGAEAIGVDPSSAMLRVARLRWRTGDRVAWRVGTAESVPADDGWATVYWSLATVHHWSDVDAGLREAARVLGPGGRLVAIERRIERTDAEGVESHGWTTEQAESFAELCRRHGFLDVRTGSHPVRGESLSVVATRP